LLGDLRRLLLEWSAAPDCAERILRSNPLSSPSRRRLHDVMIRTFIPRFVHSDPPDLWRPIQILERAGWPQEFLVPIHYYAAAAAEPLLWDFVVAGLSERHSRGQHEVATKDVLRFLDTSHDAQFSNGRWTKTVSIKVARGVLAALRDFGILSGAVKEVHLPPLPPHGELRAHRTNPL
jgi:hypothetical protein